MRVAQAHASVRAKIDSTEEIAKIARRPIMFQRTSALCARARARRRKMQKRAFERRNVRLQRARVFRAHSDRKARRTKPRGARLTARFKMLFPGNNALAHIARVRRRNRAWAKCVACLMIRDKYAAFPGHNVLAHIARVKGIFVRVRRCFSAVPERIAAWCEGASAGKSARYGELIISKNA